MLVRSARVSTDDQDLALRRDALTATGCERVFADTMSGATAEPPGLAEALYFCCPGDTRVVWRLDWLGRLLTNLIEPLNVLAARSTDFRRLWEQVGTTSGGKFVFHIFGALAEFERELIRERTRARPTAARARGRQCGRPRKLDSERKVKMTQLLYDDGTHSIDDICRTLGISRVTLYRTVTPRARQNRTRT